jgi:TetR/AcrR family transcriptional regulator, repressor for divergent bdcA
MTQDHLAAVAAPHQAPAPARRSAEYRRDQIRAFVGLTNRDMANAVTDYVASTMYGLSASAREGMSEDRLAAIARASRGGLEALLSGNRCGQGGKAK